MLFFCRHLTFRNLSMSDVAIVEFLVVLDGAPLTHLSFEGVTLQGVGRYGPMLAAFIWCGKDLA